MKFWKKKTIPLEKSQSKNSSWKNIEEKNGGLIFVFLFEFGPLNFGMILVFLGDFSKFPA